MNSGTAKEPLVPASSFIEQSEQIETQLMELMERWEQLEAEMANGSEK